jgi:hypothetical protein
MNQKIILACFYLLGMSNTIFAQSKLIGLWEVAEKQTIEFKSDQSFDHKINETIYSGTYDYTKNPDHTERLTMVYKMGEKQYRIKMVTSNLLVIVNMQGNQEMKLKRVVTKQMPDLFTNYQTEEAKTEEKDESKIQKIESYSANSPIDSNDESKKYFKPFALNLDVLNTIETFAFVGLSSSFAHGKYVDYHRSFHNIVEQNSDISGSIFPKVMATFGIGGRIDPFEGHYFENVNIRTGFQFQQRGFTNKFTSTYNSPLQFTDKTVYKEKYTFNYLSVPLVASYELGEWYGSLGLNFDFLLSASKKEKLERSQSGEGALREGFDLNDDTLFNIPKSLVNTSHTTFIVGGGYYLTNSIILELEAGLSGKVLKEDNDNFKSNTIQFKIIKNLDIL